ncbi:MAG: hypothetical protein WC869_03400 [Phycisphaerae bacterium]
MAIIAGIDEAGLGPVLGPLVVSAAAFSIPDEPAEASMWQLLSGAVTRRVPKRPSRIAIGDSKKLYGGMRGPAGLSNLERGVLAMLGTTRPLPPTLRGLLEELSPAAVARASACNWYRGLDLPLPRSMSATTAGLACNSLGESMRKAGVELLALRSEVVLEEEFNRLTDAGNKSTMLFDVACRLLMFLWNLAGGQNIRIFVDRQGGRMHYLEGLQRAFAGCSFKIIDESETSSSYRIADGRRWAEMHFSVAAEEKQLPVALASMASKYLREMLMEVLNAYWAEHVPDLLPTAGYYQDGNRFFKDILPTVRAMGLDHRLVYRMR